MGVVLRQRGRVSSKLFGNELVDWRTRAACKKADPETFFPLDDAKERSAVYAFCMRCPVRMECRKWADENGIVHGVWGGETELERRARLAGSPMEMRQCQQCERTYMPKRKNRAKKFCSQQCYTDSMKGKANSRYTYDWCGVAAGADRHRRRSEPVCEACLMAERLYRTQLKQRKKDEHAQS